MLSLLFIVLGNPSMCNKYLLNTDTVPSSSKLQKHYKFIKDEAIGSRGFVLSMTFAVVWNDALFASSCDGCLTLPCLLLTPICFSQVPFSLSKPLCTADLPRHLLPLGLLLEMFFPFCKFTPSCL